MFSVLFWERNVEVARVGFATELHCGKAGRFTPLDASPCTCKLPPYIRVFASYKYVLWYAITGTIAEVGYYNSHGFF